MEANTPAKPIGNVNKQNHIKFHMWLSLNIVWWIRANKNGDAAIMIEVISNIVGVRRPIFLFLKIKNKGTIIINTAM